MYTYLGYPFTLLIANGALGTNAPDGESEWRELPSVTLLIAAYNEEEIIAEKIRNSLKLEYPEDKLDIVVFSDASTDKTDEIVRSFKEKDVELRRIEGRVGKTECQNRVVADLETELVVFSDANSMYKPDAIVKLVHAFEPGVDCVVGELQYSDQDGVEGERTYWRYERYLKILESERGSLVTANGAIYAVRRSAYQPLSKDDISDFAEPLALVRNGGRIVYEPKAIATEHTAAATQSELERRIRIITRSWRTFANFIELSFFFERPAFAFRLISHKTLRWLSPVFLLCALVTNAILVVLIESPVVTGLLAAQIAFYLLAAIGRVYDSTQHSAPIIAHVPYYFLVANYGMGVGLAKFATSNSVITWETNKRNAN